MVRRPRAVARWIISGRNPGPHVTRHAMYARLREVTATLVSDVDRVLSVSHSDGLCAALGLPAPIEADWPEHDLRRLKFDDDSFDWVVADQVLEHVEGDPFRAFAEAVRVTRPGGFVLVAVPTAYPRHLAPDDYWRFTSDGLRSMAGGLEIIEVGAWGNRAVWVLDLLGLRRAPIPGARWHPLRKIADWNEPDWPVVSWLIARKPHEPLDRVEPEP